MDRLIRVWVFCLALVLVFLALGCTKKEDAASNTGAKAIARNPIPVEVTEARLVECVDTLDIVGGLEPKYEAAVRAEYPGMIAEVYVNEWVDVQEGQPLARLDTREADSLVLKGRSDAAASRASVARAEATCERCAKDFERSDQLHKKGVLSPQELDRARMERDAAAAELESARNRLKSDEEALRQNELRVTKSLIRSPMAGKVALRRVNVGDQAESYSMGEPLFRIVDIKRLNLVLTVPSASLGQVKVGQPVIFETDTVPGRKFEAKVSYINPAAEAGSRSVKILAEVDNTDSALRPGVFAKAQLEMGRRTDILQIPRLALLDTGAQLGMVDVFVVPATGSPTTTATLAQRKSVKVGKSLGEAVEILSGLSAGDRVVTRGAFVLRDGDPVRIVNPAKQSGD